MESWVGLGRKESHTKIQISAEPGSNQEPSSLRVEILLTVPTMAAQGLVLKLFSQQLLVLKGSISQQQTNFNGKMADSFWADQSCSAMWLTAV